METCFAWKQNAVGELECAAIEQKCNGCNKECRFYKTPAEYERDNAKQNRHPIKSFGLFIDGRKHGDFGSIKEIDDYLMTFYASNVKWENAKARLYHRWWKADDWQMVYFNHNIHFAYPKE